MSILIMRTAKGFYPVEASGKKGLLEEAQDHGKLNPHVNSIEDINGKVLWERSKRDDVKPFETDNPKIIEDM